MWAFVVECCCVFGLLCGCCVASDANWLVVIFMEEVGLGASHFMRIVISELDWRDFVLRKVGFHMVTFVYHGRCWYVSVFC